MNPMSGVRKHRCQMVECKHTAVGWVSKGGTNKHVCRHCQEILKADKWKTLKW